jgi:hypothetical protein
MNEQIDQLMVKAGAYFGGDGVVYDNFDPKKFAELIVRECARAVDKVYEDAEPDHGCYDWATWAEGADVLKHFGIEE